MSWQQVAIDADSRIAERFADTLMELGALSTAIEDAAAGTEFDQRQVAPIGLANASFGDAKADAGNRMEL